MTRTLRLAGLCLILSSSALVVTWYVTRPNRGSSSDIDEPSHKIDAGAQSPQPLRANSGHDDPARSEVPVQSDPGEESSGALTARLTPYEHEFLTRRLVGMVNSYAMRLAKIEPEESKQLSESEQLRIAKARLNLLKEETKLDLARANEYVIDTNPENGTKSTKNERWMIVSTGLLDVVDGESTRTRHTILYPVTRSKHPELFKSWDTVGSLQHSIRHAYSQTFNKRPFAERVKIIEASRRARKRMDEIEKTMPLENNPSSLRILKEEHRRLADKLIPDGQRVHRLEFTLSPR